MSKPKAIKHTHWLYGHGPNMEITFDAPVAHETNCRECIHDHVCKRDMAVQCRNYTFGNSDRLSGCHTCMHRFSRWDNSVRYGVPCAVPCFNCKDFKPA